jgi:hypothetical protein
LILRPGIKIDQQVAAENKIVRFTSKTEALASICKFSKDNPASSKVMAIERDAFDDRCDTNRKSKLG